ncbi:MAG: CoA-binding protein [Sphingobacteriaceae bacterium]|nr:CoA-binding protein [Sphingobacteriaceae bacterium]
MKPTVIIGASSNPERYSYKATKSLKAHGHKVYPVGVKQGDIEGEKILTNKPVPGDVDTVTMYLSAKNQKDWYEYILSLKPKRIIFNPGAENPELVEKAKTLGVESIEACTLVMLSIGNY